LNGTAIGGSTSATYTANATGNYSVTVTNANGCSATSAATAVLVNNLPSAIITAGGATTFCSGSSVSLSANSGTGLTYQWSNGSNNQTITVSTAGNYTVTVTNADGCSSTSSATAVTVTALPVVASITGTTAVCTGSTTTLSSTTGSGVWTSSNPSVASIISSTGVVTGVTAGTSTITYTVTAGGCTNSTTTVVTVNALPTATITTIGTTTFCTGGSVSLVGPSAPAGMTYSYQWNVDGSAISGATSSSYTASAAGSYTLTVTNNNGCSATSAATVVTVNALPTLASIGGTTSACIGSSTVLTNAQLGGTWSSSNTATAIVNSSTGSVTGVSAGTATITYTYTNSNNCTNTVTAAVTVNALPTVAAITGATNVCSGLTTQLASATIGGTWSSSNAAVASVSTSGVVTGVTAGATTIVYTVTNVNGCTSAVSATVNVNAGTTASITAGGATTFCQGGSVVLTANAGSTYLWSNGASTQSITASASGSYYVTVSNAAGCSATSTAAVVTQIPNPVVDIYGVTDICVGQTELFSSNIQGGTWSLPISQPIVDQSNTQYMNQAGSTSQYQTFTAGVSGTLNSIAVNHANPQGNTAVSTVTVKVYSGAGTSGTLLGSNTVTLPAQWGSNWNVYTYNGISVIQGQVYTFEVTTPNVVFSWLNVDVNNQYNGGAYGPSISGWDMIFETNVSPSYGTINQSGQFTCLKVCQCFSSCGLTLISMDGHAGNTIFF
jgi:uncharacterized protein YjdB